LLHSHLQIIQVVLLVQQATVVLLVVQEMLAIKVSMETQEIME
jgi:hypothetical protein